MFKDNIHSEIENLLPPHCGLYVDKQQGLFYVHYAIDRMIHTTGCDTSDMGY